MTVAVAVIAGRRGAVVVVSAAFARFAAAPAALPGLATVAAALARFTTRIRAGRIPVSAATLPRLTAPTRLARLAPGGGRELVEAGTVREVLVVVIGAALAALAPALVGFAGAAA